MAIDRKLLVSAEKKLKIGENGQPADKNCCCTNPCPNVTLLCDRTSITKNRCGFEPLIPSPTYPAPFSSVHWTDCHEFGSYLDVAIGDDSCDGNARFLSYEVTLTGCNDHTGTGCPASGECIITQTFDPSTCLANEQDLSACNLLAACSDDDPGCSITSCGDTPGDPISNALTASTIGAYVLGDEYTDGLLFGNAQDDLPDYPDTWDGSCVAGSGFLDSPSNLQYSFGKIRYKFATTIPRGCKLIIFWNETFYANGSESPTSIIAKTWTYDHGIRSHTGGEPIAIGDNVGCAFDDPLESDIYEIVPSNNDDGSYIITDIRWSFSEDYEPPQGNPDIFNGDAGHVRCAFGPNCSEDSDSINFPDCV